MSKVTIHEIIRNNYDDEAVDKIKDLIQTLIDETFDKDDIKALELWEKVKAL